MDNTNTCGKTFAAAQRTKLERFITYNCTLV